MQFFSSSHQWPEGEEQPRQHCISLSSGCWFWLRLNEPMQCPVFCSEQQDYCYIPSFDAKGEWLTTTAGQWVRGGRLEGWWRKLRSLWNFSVWQSYLGKFSWLNTSNHHLLQNLKLECIQEECVPKGQACDCSRGTNAFSCTWKDELLGLHYVWSKKSNWNLTYLLEMTMVSIRLHLWLLKVCSPLLGCFTGFLNCMSIGLGWCFFFAGWYQVSSLPKWNAFELALLWWLVS